MGDPVSSIFYHAHHDFGRGHDASFGVGATAASSTPEDLFSIFDGLEGVCEFPPMTPLLQDGSTPNEAGEEMKYEGGDGHALVSQKSSSSIASLLEFETSSNDVVNGSCSSSPDQKNKRQKVMPADTANKDGGRKDCINPHPADLHPVSEDQRMQKMSHITVERNRRKQMNEHLSVLRSLMPCFYVKRGDQASIIGGVVEYISELQTLVQSLESKKQRKAYSEVLSPRLVSSPRVVSSPRPSQPVISPTKKPPLSPRLPISPRTPTPGSPYSRSSSRILSHQQQQYHHLSSSYTPPPPPQPTIASSPSSTTSSSTNNNNNNNINDAVNELVARLKSPMADVEVRFSGANVEVNTVSSRWIQGQVTKMISSIEHLSLEILSLNVNTIEDTMITSFTIKIGIECQLSAEDLAHQIQQTFC